MAAPILIGIAASVAANLIGQLFQNMSGKKAEEAQKAELERRKNILMKDYINSSDRQVKLNQVESQYNAALGPGINSMGYKSRDYANPNVAKAAMIAPLLGEKAKAILAMDNSIDTNNREISRSIAGLPIVESQTGFDAGSLIGSAAQGAMTGWLMGQGKSNDTTNDTTNDTLTDPDGDSSADTVPKIQGEALNPKEISMVGAQNPSMPLYKGVGAGNWYKEPTPFSLNRLEGQLPEDDYTWLDEKYKTDKYKSLSFFKDDYYNNVESQKKISKEYSLSLEGIGPFRNYGGDVGYFPTRDEVVSNMLRKNQGLTLNTPTLQDKKKVNFNMLNIHNNTIRTPDTLFTPWRKWFDLNY